MQRWKLVGVAGSFSPPSLPDSLSLPARVGSWQLSSLRHGHVVLLVLQNLFLRLQLPTHHWWKWFYQRNSLASWPIPYSWHMNKIGDIMNIHHTISQYLYKIGDIMNIHHTTSQSLCKHLQRQSNVWNNIWKTVAEFTKTLSGRAAPIDHTNHFYKKYTCTHRDVRELGLTFTA